MLKRSRIIGAEVMTRTGRVGSGNENVFMNGRRRVVAGSRKAEPSDA